MIRQNHFCATALLLSVLLSPSVTSINKSTYPATRRFLTLPAADLETSSSTLNPLILRVLQFNSLADGLAGLRPDLGRFNRASREILCWDHRKSRILHEITQYEPDIITMQEVDHYYDFFLPELSARGYTGYFAPKPTSACLEVSKNEDGCAMFVKRNRLRVISCETKTLALSIAGLNTDGELVEDDKSIKAQSQVGLIAVCEICNWEPPIMNGTNKRRILTLDEYDDSHMREIEEEEARRNSPPPIIISTTHLKSSKSYTGERYRQKGVMQILNDTDKIYTAMSAAGRTPAVVLLGCFNAIAQQCTYPPLTYRAVKGHRLGLRSVYNEDVPLSDIPLSSKELYSTWKSREKFEKELVVKRSIDYIFYTPFIKGTKEKKIPATIVENTENAVAYNVQQVFITILLRLLVFFAWGLLPITSIVSSTMDWSEKIVVVSLSIIGLSIFEVASEGTVFKPEMAAPYSSIAPKFLAMSAEKLAEKRDAEKMIRARVGALSNYFLPKESNGRPGLHCISALDVFSDGDMGQMLIPSESYPSDHIAIASDLQLLW